MSGAKGARTIGRAAMIDTCILRPEIDAESACGSQTAAATKWGTKRYLQMNKLAEVIA
jgi:hypothetical protein